MDGADGVEVEGLGDENERDEPLEVDGLGAENDRLPELKLLPLASAGPAITPMANRTTSTRVRTFLTQAQVRMVSHPRQNCADTRNSVWSGELLPAFL